MIENAFQQILANASSVTDLLDANGIHYQKNEYSDQNKYIIYSVQSQERPVYIDNATGQKRTGMQVDLYSPTQTEVMMLRNAVVTLIHAKSNTQYGHNIQYMSIDFELSSDDDSTELYRIILTVNFYYH